MPASKNLPSIRMHTGIRRGLPFSGSCNRAVARGPLLFGPVREVWAQRLFGVKADATRMTDQASLLYNLERDGETPMDLNDKAPDFTLLDENEKPVSLKDFRGKTVIVFFFPKADTPG